MGQFKPMVKMETTEPSVILKLKKGGKVRGGEGSEGHEPMQGRAHAMHEAMEAESGKAPKKPSMADRRSSMKPKMARKAMGGPMGAPMAPPMGAPAPMAPPMAARPPMAPPMAPMGRQALMGMPAGQRNSRAAMVRKALAGMKKGGSTSSGYAKLKKELRHHESLSSGAAHPQRKANGGTVGVRMGNAGGFAKGGDVGWENRPADTASAGKSNTTTGGVKKGNGGGFKRGGSAPKKAYATGGKVDDGKAVKMPKHSVSRPVANTLQSGTFANGGDVNWTKLNPTLKDKYNRVNAPAYSPSAVDKSIASSNQSGKKIDSSEANSIHRLLKGRYAEGGKVGFDEGGSADMSKGAYDRHYANEKAENEADRKSILDLPKRLYEGAKSLFSPAVPKPPAGSVTKTEKSVTVAPRKSGGQC